MTGQRFYRSYMKNVAETVKCCNVIEVA